MVRRNDWGKGEFAILISSPHMTDEEVQREIGTRELGAVKMVRWAVHDYHRSRQANDRLSHMMVSYLEARDGILTCCCGELIEVKSKQTKA